jgi:crotonobetainyl-CoA:carnitine CoA-transferase CaiB-like acyl-CoA transferase
VLDFKQPAGRRRCSVWPATPTSSCTTSARKWRALRPGIREVPRHQPAPRLLRHHGFRAAGPYGAKPAYDDIIQAATGLASLQAPLVGDPRYLPTIVADKTSSMAVLSSILAALVYSARTGRGQALEVPMFESVAAWVMVEHLYGAAFVPPLDTAGYKRILNRWRRPFPTKNGYLAVLPYTDANWKTFFELAAGRSPRRPRYATASRSPTSRCCTRS